MNITIDPEADAATVVWGERAAGKSMQVDVPGKGVRLFLSPTGDVVGLEVLGWSQRATEPSGVDVRLAGAAEALADDDPFAAALLATSPQPGHMAGHPTDDDGRSMLTLRDVAERLGKDRSWLNRQLQSGKLRGRQIGREWWISEEWLRAYQEAHTAATPAGGQLATIRDWARRNGHNVSDRGRIAASVQNAYVAANSTDTASSSRKSRR